MRTERRKPDQIGGLAKSTFGIRGRLMALAMIALIPLIFDRVRAVEGDRADRIEAASNQAIEFARRGADDQNELLATTRAFLQVVARAYGTVARDADACGRFLVNLSMGLPWARAISVAGPDGRIVCSSNPGSIGLDISDRSHFTMAVQTRDFVVSEYLLGRRLTGPNIFASVPHLAPDGAVEAVVVGVLDVKWIERLTRALAERSGSAVLLVDRTGTVIARQPDPDAWVGRQFADHPLIRTMLAGSEGAVAEQGLDGVRRIFGFVQLPGTETRLAVGLDEKEVLRRVNGEARRSYIQLGIMGILILAGIWLGGERFIVRPIESMALAAKRVGRGEMARRISDQPWSAEFAPLAAAMDEMAAKVAAREDEMRLTNDHLAELTCLDGLTDIMNRRGFDAELQAQWERSAKLKRPVALLMIDVDHFKLFNDAQGHLAGDACLKELSKVLALVAKSESGVAARFGGEEFVLLLPSAALKRAVEVAERLRTAVEMLDIAHEGGQYGHVTVSVGVASQLPTAVTEVAHLVEAADAALYDAKHRGRNRVAAHPPAELRAAG